MGAKIQEPNLRDHLSTPKCLTERLPILFLGGALLVARRRTILMLACPRSQSGKRESRNAQDWMDWPRKSSSSPNGPAAGTFQFVWNRPDACRRCDGRSKLPGLPCIPFRIGTCEVGWLSALLSPWWGVNNVA